MPKRLRLNDHTVLRAWPAILAFVVSQAILAGLGFLYHGFLWSWPIFLQVQESYEASLPQILLFDVFGFILPGLVAVRALRRRPRDLGFSAPDVWTWVVVALLAATILVAGGALSKTDRLFSIIGLNLLAYQVVISVTEEGFFRGFLQSEFVRVLGRWSGSLLQIALFAIAPAILMSLVNEQHFKVIAVQIVVFYIPVGIVSTVLRNLTGSVWPCIIGRLALGLIMVL